MLALLAERMQTLGVGYALHTSNVPNKKRHLEIQRFKTDNDCRLFLSSDAGSTGLNLPVANVVVNLDLPWNPAKLAQCSDSATGHTRAR